MIRIKLSRYVTAVALKILSAKERAVPRRNVLLIPIFATVLLTGLLGLTVFSTALAGTPPVPTYGTATVDGDYSDWDLNEDFFANMYVGGDPTKSALSRLYLRYECTAVDQGTLYALVLISSTVPISPTSGYPVTENHIIALSTDEDAPVEGLSTPADVYLNVDGTKRIDGYSSDEFTFDAAPLGSNLEWIGLTITGTKEIYQVPFGSSNMVSPTWAIGWEASSTLVVPGDYQPLFSGNKWSLGLNVHSNVYNYTSEQLVKEDTAAVLNRHIALTIDCTPPLPVTLSYVYSERDGDVVHFKWETATETGNAGFNLYVENDGSRSLITSEMIPSTVIDSVEPVGYTYEDDVVGDQFYIEMIDIDGTSEFRGPFSLGEVYGLSSVSPGGQDIGGVRNLLFLPAISTR